MKKMLVLLLLMVAAIGVKAQSQYFCRATVQTSIDSWNYKVFKDPSWTAPGAIQINITTYTYGGGSRTTGWLGFVNGQNAGSVGNAGYSVIEIRVVNFLTGAVLYQFQVTNAC